MDNSVDNVKNSLVFHSICVGGGVYVDEQIVNIQVNENEYIRMRPVDKTGYEKIQKRLRYFEACYKSGYK